MGDACLPTAGALAMIAGVYAAIITATAEVVVGCAERRARTPSDCGQTKTPRSAEP